MWGGDQQKKMVLLRTSECMCRSEDLSMADKNHLRQHNSLLAAYLEHFESIAEEVDSKGGRSQDHYLKQTAHRIKANVRSLRQVSRFKTKTSVPTT